MSKEIRNSTGFALLWSVIVKQKTCATFSTNQLQTTTKQELVASIFQWFELFTCSYF